jgi:hypothetical protein
MPPQEPTHSTSTSVNSTTVKITSVTIEANYYKVSNNVSDMLAGLQTPTEQSIYHRLYRLSYGYNRNVCRVGMQALAKATNIASKKTIATAISGLVAKGHIAIVQEAGGDVRGTWYRVFLPDEIAEIQKRTGAKNSTVNFTVVKNSAVNFTNSTSVKNSAVNFTPELQSIENKSQDPTSVKNSAVNFTPITTDLLQTLSLPEIVDQFYALLKQQPSERKRERGMQQGIKLLQEGFTLDDLHYTIAWIVQKYPDTKAFDRVPYFIDQALKAREAEKRAYEVQQQYMVTDRHKQHEHERAADDQKRLEEIKQVLGAEVLVALQEEARCFVNQQHSHITVGHDLLIRYKIDELIKERYWNAPVPQTNDPCDPQIFHFRSELAAADMSSSSCQ